MLEAGKVENWVVLSTVHKLSMNKLPIRELKFIADSIQNNYRGTLGRCWIVQCTSFQMFCWHVVEAFMEDQTKQMISLHKEANPSSLVDNFHPS